MDKIEQRYIAFLQDVLISLHANIHETNERKNFAESAELDYIEGRLAAYREMLAMLKQSAKEFQLPADEIGL